MVEVSEGLIVGLMIALAVGIVVFLIFAICLEGALRRVKEELKACKDELKEYGSLFTDKREEITIELENGKKRDYEVRPAIGKAQIINYQGNKGPKGLYEIRQITHRR